MKTIQNLRLSVQLSLLAGVFLLLAGGLVNYALLQLHKNQSVLVSVVDERVAGAQKVHAARESLRSTVDAARAASRRAFDAETAAGTVRDAREMFREQWQAYLASEPLAEEEALMARAQPKLDAASEALDRLQRRLETGDVAGLDPWTESEVAPVVDEATNDLKAIVDYQIAAAVHEREAAAEQYKTTMRNTLLVALLATLLVVALAAWLIRSVLGRLGVDPAEATQIAKRIADGDFGFDVAHKPGDEASLLAALRAMKGSLLHSKLEYEGQIAGIHLTQAVIEFTPDGTVLAANENFLKTMGYTLDEIKGKHHSMFIEAQERQSTEYAGFWPRLARGEPFIGRARRIARDGREVMMQCIYNPLPDANGKTFKVVKYATDITAEHKEAALNEAFKGALNKLSANVMVADSDSKIIYMNEGADRLMTDSEADFRAQLPSFSRDRILGQSFDIFHKNPAHQRGLLTNLKGRHETQVKIAGRMMKLVANPMYDDAGRRLGTVVEWFDRTQEVATEAELQQMITAVTAGDFSGRIALAGKTGFFESLSRGINDLVDSVATVVDEVQGLVKAANEGDLTFRVRLEGRAGLLVKIGSGINQLTDNMASLVARVKSAAGEVSRGADEISQGNTNLSQRTEEQASSLEETASSMEEMTSTVKQNADNAGQANQLAVAARDQAEKGGAVVARAVKAMSEINDASKRIADIIGVIDEIAFQTNLLALNAAVEAARAGEQGRGFAVVASEVRNLAGRSATAAKEIKALIQDSVRKVDEGSSLVTQSGSTLEQIVSAVKKVTDIVAEIAAASHEQSSGIEQVNKAVMQLDELTQQNAALVEEASAASQAMAEQARGLNDALSIYTVDDKALVQVGAFGNVGHAAAPAAAAPERRAAVKRPWTKKPAPAAAPALKATGTGDDVWKEF